MGQAPKKAECSVATKFILFNKWEECAAYVAAKLVLFDECTSVASGKGSELRGARLKEWWWQ